MSDIFKKSFKELMPGTKPDSFAQALLGAEFSSWAFISNKKLVKNKTSKTNLKQTGNSDAELSEKRVVLDSLNQFTQKIKSEGRKSLEFPGGRVEIKEDSQKESMKEIVLKDSFENLGLYLSSIDNKQKHSFSSRLDKLLEQKNIDVMFLSDSLQLEPLYQAPHENFDELRYLFKEDTAILLSRMISAMKLTRSSFVLSAIEVEGEESKSYLHEIALLKPKYVITLGARSTHALLELNDRLSHIHGKFFQRKVIAQSSSHEFSVMPLFHPEFLRINPNMKKTAWVDMQKVMNRISN